MTGQQPFRLDPQGPVGAYKTYAISAPVATHSRPATCEEAGCLNYHNGWITKVPVGSDLEDAIKASGRKWSYVAKVGPNHEYTFPAGTECFRSSTHRVPLDRPQLFVVRDGDWRGNDTGRSFRHSRPEHWVEDFAEHQDRIKTLHDRG